MGAELTVDEQIKLVTGHGSWHVHGIEGKFDEIAVADGPHGLRKQDESAKTNNDSIRATCFPTASALACSFSEDTVAQVAGAIADEALIEDVSVLLGPGINMKRSPLCGRNFEYFSEDPYLAGKLGSAYVSAVQAKGVGTSLKHFATNNQETHRMSVNNSVDERALREIYLSAFERVVKEAKPATIMASYNRLNGYYACENKHLLRDILKGEWGYEGVVVSDWGACTDLAASIEAGMDLEMPDSLGGHTRFMKDRIDAGKMDMDALKDAAGRIARMNQTWKNKGQYKVPDNKEELLKNNDRIAREAAEQCAVLLKNDGVLPVAPSSKLKKIYIVGELAERVRFQGGGSSHINTKPIVTLMEALKAKGYETVYLRGYDSDRMDADEKMEGQISRELSNWKEELRGGGAVSQDKTDSDMVVIFCGGLTNKTEGEGFDRTTLQLPENQQSLYKRVRFFADKLIYVSFSGAPYDMSPMQDADAILQMYLGGQAVMEACANLLTGQVNPSGRLAETYPVRIEDTPAYDHFGDYNTDDCPYYESLFIGYRFYERFNKKVLYPFGYGLSYTSFEYSDIVVDGHKVSFRVTNTGSVAGAEVCQLYVVNPVCSYLRAKRELRAFTKVYLEPGESADVTLELEDRAFQIYDVENGGYVTAAGEYGIEVGSGSQDIRLKAELTVEGVNIDRDDRIELSGYYGRFEPDLHQFERLYGAKVPDFTHIKPGEYSMYSSLKQMAKVSRRARMWLGFARRFILTLYRGKSKDDPELNMMLEFMQDAPIDSVVNQSGGYISYKAAQKVVNSANRKK